MPHADRPNVLFVVSDQHHPRFMGCAGHPFLHTPHMDALAAAGTRLGQAYCNFPLCGPSRWSMMTGCYASQLNHLANFDHCANTRPAFAHLFAAAGYRTALCGRMHFHGPAHRFGFQEWLGGNLEHHAQYRTGLRDVLGDTLCATTGPNARAIRHSGPGDSGYLAYDRALTEIACDWLRRHADRPGTEPFMLLLGYVQPHAPFVAPPEDYQRYDRLIDVADLPRPHPATLHPELRRLQRRAGLEDADPVPLEDQRRARVAYHGMCTFADRMLGQLLATLDRIGQRRDTIVVYTSDHGEQLGEHGMWWKHTFYEGSIGIPMLMAGPGIPAGQVIQRNVGLMDLPATLQDLCGVSPTPRAAARSFRCLLEGDAARWDDQVLAENLWPNTAAALHRMLKRGPWKLNHYPGFAPELYNLDQDPGEMHNRADDPTCAAVRQDLESRLLRDWDHEAIMAAHRLELEIEKLMLPVQRQCVLPEPLERWNQRVTYENRIDATEGRT